MITAYMRIGTWLCFAGLLAGSAAAQGGKAGLQKIPYGWSNVGGIEATLSKSGACASGRCPYVVRAWSGAALDRAGKRLILFGGGHGDYDGNEEYALSYGSEAARFTRIFGPTQPGNFTCSNIRSEIDGHGPEQACTKGLPALRSEHGACYENPSAEAPNSRHSYAGVAGVELETGHPALFVVGGSFACGSGSGDQHDAWIQDLSTLSWKHLAVPKPWTASLGSIIAENSGHPGSVYLAGDDQVGEFNFGNGNYRELNGAVGGAIYQFGAVDRSANEFVMFEPHNGINRLLAINLQNGKGRDLTASAAGCKALIGPGAFATGASGIAWDELDHSLVIWPNFGAKIYAYKNGNCTMEDYGQDGTPPADSAHGGDAKTTNGTYGRWQNVGPGLFVLVNDWDLPPKFLCRQRSGCERP